MASALAQALRPPFAAEMQARLAADPDAPVAWQIDAVIGDGVVGLDLVGRPVGSERPPRAGRRTAHRPLRQTRAWRRSRGRSRRSDRATPPAWRRSPRAVGEAAGAECVAYTVRRGDVVEKALGWRLPPA